MDVDPLQAQMGAMGWQLLPINRRDENNDICPLTWAIVATENKESWTQFINNFLGDIGSMKDEGWTFISNRQKVMPGCQFVMILDSLII